MSRNHKPYRENNGLGSSPILYPLRELPEPPPRVSALAKMLSDEMIQRDAFAVRVTDLETKIMQVGQDNAVQKSVIAQLTTARDALAARANRLEIELDEARGRIDELEPHAGIGSYAVPSITTPAVGEPWPPPAAAVIAAELLEVMAANSAPTHRRPAV